MPGGPPPICTQCGQPLGSKSDEIEHPEDPDPPEDAHFKVQIRDDDEERLQCKDTGRLASVATPGDENIGGDNLSYAELFQKHHNTVPPGMGEGQTPPSDKNSQTDRPNEDSGGVYDIQPEKDQRDILKEVIDDPSYALDDEHKREIIAWADDMDGRLPPNTLEDILKNLKGVQKQTAELVRQRYELKLNKWMRDQSNAENGPPIGVTMPTMSGQSSSSSGLGRLTPIPQPQQKSENQTQTEEARTKQGRQVREAQSTSSDNLREYRRTRRTKRRQDTLDIASEQVAKEAADEIAREIATNFGGLLSIPQTVLRRKAEKDPDWFLEKAEQFDIDVVDIMEPSEQRKKEMQDNDENVAPEVDNEVDNALESVVSGNNSSNESPTETSNTPTAEERDVDPMSASPDEFQNIEDADEPDVKQHNEQRAGEELFE